MRRLRSLRVLTIVVLAALALQYELGITVNLSPRLKEGPAVGLADLGTALAAVGGDAVTHAVLGTILPAAALAGLVLSVISGTWSVAVIGVLAFLATTLAAINGVLFTTSGFGNDGYSHGMATGFLASFSLYFILVAVVSVKLRRRD